jgi:hypothetical protein
MLEPSATAGLVSTQQSAPPIPDEPLNDLEETLREWLEHGTSGTPAAWVDRLARLEARCRSEDLVWPAELIGELAREVDRYRSHDALFDPGRTVELIGELVIRIDGIRSDTKAVPQLLIRGTRSDQPVEIDRGRYTGLGCGVRVARRSVELLAYLQDAYTGTVVAVGREIADPQQGSAEPAREFAKLAQATAVQGNTLAALAAGQLLMQGGKRSPGHRLVIGRARAAVNPQVFAWEKLRAPALVEDFDELRARLGMLPPSSLRPRRVAEDFHVVATAEVKEFGFDAAAQVVRATILDAHGGHALMEHPYHDRGREGVEALLARLARGPSDSLRFVAGPARLGPRGLVITPTALIFQDGSARTILQPWIDRGPGCAEAGRPSGGEAGHPIDPIDDYPRQLLTALGELALLGLRRADDQSARAWHELARFGTAIGFDRLARPVAGLAQALEAKTQTPRWDSHPAARIALELSALARLAMDVSR